MKFSPAQTIVTWLAELPSRYEAELEECKTSNRYYHEEYARKRAIEFRNDQINYCNDLIAVISKPKYGTLRYFHFGTIFETLLNNKLLTRHVELVLEDAMQPHGRNGRNYRLDDLNELAILNRVGTSHQTIILDAKALSRELSKAVRLLSKEYGSGPEQCREEVTGLSTKGKNKNMSNSGFGGGTMARLAAA